MNEPQNENLGSFMQGSSNAGILRDRNEREQRESREKEREQRERERAEREREQRERKRDQRSEREK